MPEMRSKYTKQEESVLVTTQVLTLKTVLTSDIYESVKNRFADCQLVQEQLQV